MTEHDSISKFCRFDRAKRAGTGDHKRKVNSI